MNNSIKTILGIKDPYLKLDEKNFDNPIEDQPNQIIVHLIQTYPMHCPKCGHLMCKNGYKTVNCLGPELHFKPTIWSIKKQKYICKASSSCPEVVTKLAAVEDIHYRNHISLAIKQRAMMLLTKNESQSDLAKELNVSDWTIRRVITNLDQFFKPNYHWLPRHIAFDDFKSGRFATSGMSMILMNPVNHRTIDVISSRTSKSLKQYFYRHFTRKARLSVKLVVVDLYQPYRPLIHELFPYAQIIADHFHIVAQAYRVLQKIRTKTMNYYGAGSHESRALKRFWKLLLQKVSELDNVRYHPCRNFKGAWLTNSEVVDRLLDMSPELKEAYDYYQTLISAIDNEDSAELQTLLNRKLTELPFKLQKVQRTLRQHKDEILCSFKYHLSNGPIEGTNNKIKVIKRTAYGFRNFYHFRIGILIALKNSHLTVSSNCKTKNSPSKMTA